MQLNQRATRIVPMKDPLSPMYRNMIRGLRPVLIRLMDQRWTGQENIPSSGGFVAASNHLSYTDPIIVAHFLIDSGRAPRFLAKASLFEYPVVKQIMEQCGQIPVYRGTARASDAYSAAIAALTGDGSCIEIPPEGTLTRDPDLWPMAGKSGAARIALETGVPLVPISVWGPHELMRPYVDKFPRFRPRRTMQVHAGPAVDLSDLRDRPITRDVVREATGRLMAAITEGVAELRGEPAPAARFNPATAPHPAAPSEQDDSVWPKAAS